MRRGSLPVAGLVRDDTGTAGRVEVWWPSEGHVRLVSKNVIAPAWQVGQQVWLQGTAGLVVSRVICNSGLVGYGVRCWSVRKQELGKVRAEVAHGDLRQREVSRGRACTSSSWRLPPRGGVMARAMCTQGAGVVTREALEVGDRLHLDLATARLRTFGWCTSDLVPYAICEAGVRVRRGRIPVVVPGMTCFGPGWRKVNVAGPGVGCNVRLEHCAGRFPQNLCYVVVANVPAGGELLLWETCVNAALGCYISLGASSKNEGRFSI